MMADHFLWKTGKQTIGQHSTRAAFLLLFFSSFYNELIIRCFSNSVETIFQIISFYYFLQVKCTFDRNVCLLTASLTLAFMIRNTSPIGWPPLLLMKVIKDGALVPFLIAGFTVFVPVVGLSILVDSHFYGIQHFPVVTALNFYNANVAEGLSLYFGVHPAYFYVLAVVPLIFLAQTPLIVTGIYTYARDSLAAGARGTPYLALFVAFYLTVYSLIQHKEARFLLPIVPFCFLMAGHLVSKMVKQQTRWLRLYLWLVIIVEVGAAVFFLRMQHRNWEVTDYL
jgi:GPI mannosyltransferase 3